MCIKTWGGGGGKKSRDRLFSVISSEKMRNNRHTLKERKSLLNTTKNCEGSQTLEHIAQKGCRVSILAHIQNLTRHGQGSWTS